MADSFVNEGDTIYDGQGKPFVMRGGQPVPTGQAATSGPATGADETPSAWQDIKRGAVPWAGQAAAGLLGTPAALADIAARGAGWAAGKLPDSMSGVAGAVQHGAQSVSSGVSNYTPEAWEKSMEGAIPDIHYQPQTSAGGFVRTLEGFAPATAAAALMGPEALVPSLIRGTGAALGSEALGQGVEAYTGQDSTEGSLARMAGALAGGKFAPRAVTPFPATAARTAQAEQVGKSLEPFGGSVDAAQATGSPRLRLWQGDAQNQGPAVTQALFDKAGVPFNPNGTEKLPAILAREEAQWKQQANAIGKNTNVVPDNKFWQDFQRHETDAKAALHSTHDAAALQEVQDARDNLNSLFARVNGQPTIAGPKYVNLLEKWRDSPNRFVKSMGSSLQDAAERSPGGQVWQESNERFANLQGLKHAAEGADRTVDPAKVAAGMYKNTPMRDLADSMGNILKPVTPAAPTGLGKLAAAGAGAAMGGAHLLPGGAVGGGVEGAVLGTLLGEQAKDSVGRMSQALMRTKPAQSYLGNQLLLPHGAGASGGALGSYGPRLNPRQAAMALGVPSVVSMQRALNSPEQASY